MIFHQGRLPDDCKNLNFLYGDRSVEIVNNYMYLGVHFSDSGTFIRAAKNFINSAKFASGRVISMIERLRSSFWSMKIGLLNSMSLSALLYSSEIWSLRHMEDDETVQISFLKRVLKLPKNTPAYAVRIETGRLHLQHVILKSVIRWCTKLLKMEANRLPKFCFDELRHLAAKYPHSKKINWFFQIQDLINFNLNNDLVDTHEIVEIENIVNDFSAILESCKIFLISKDFMHLEKSKNLQLLPFLPLSWAPQPYLSVNCPDFFICILASIRLSNFYRCFFRLRDF